MFVEGSACPAPLGSVAMLAPRVPTECPLPLEEALLPVGTSLELGSPPGPWAPDGYTITRSFKTAERGWNVMP